ncbi:MAG: hypothetical protein LBV80_03520 [Deltaproteobacteria bacterium]|jgi:DNA/RNA-binding domain of Phe-tRNA-synthetase-like protein|nr:hypothetical protein [Deltaproteobacteria bacterium]
MKFTVSKELFEVLGEACFGVVAVQGLDNNLDLPVIRQDLAEQIAAREAEFENKKVKEDAQIVPYREAFQALGINPNKYMCSIEALLSRIAKKKGMPNINAGVDLGNAVSLKYCLPMGAHDLDTMQGDIEIRRAAGQDTFVPFGETVAETPDAGEMVYVSGHTVRTRRWTWRQSEHGKITAATSSIFYPIDGFKNVNEAKVLAARDELAAKAKSLFNCKVITGFVDKHSPEFELTF